MAEEKHVHKQLDTPKKAGIDRKKDGTIELTIVIPWDKAAKAQAEIETDLIKNVSLAGFRKGQAPKHIAKEKLNQELVREEVLKKIVGTAYNEAIKTYNLNPIISPRVHIETFADGTDIIFTAETAEEPEVILKDYKNEVKNLTAKSKIIIPGKEEARVSLDEILSLVLKTAEVKIPDILVENEVSRLLSQMLDELKKLGLTLDQYLESRKTDPEKLRLEYKSKAENDLKIEFILRKIADSEKIRH